jgi:transitional endoplasmic reticulum ATPase
VTELAIPTPVKAKTQHELLDDALNLLREAGGGIHGDDTIARHQGTQILIPESMTLEEMVAVGVSQIEAENEINHYSRQYRYRPFDGARSTARVLKAVFGSVLGKTVNTFFGSEPPQLVDVWVGVDQSEQVPWGRLGLPPKMGRKAYLDLGSVRDRELGPVFVLEAYAPRKWKAEIEGLFNFIEADLRNHSIYRGKAVTASDNPTFVDTTKIEFDDVVYTEQVMEDLEAYVWASIRYPQELRDRNMASKRVTIAYGKYGTGKTLLAYLTAKLCEEWSEAHPDDPISFFQVRPGQDSWINAMQMGKIVGRCIIFIEDIDIVFNPDTGQDLSLILDQLDGMLSKGSDVSLIATTNFIDKIPKGVLRFGRTDVVLEIGNMDRPGLEKFTRHVIGDNLVDVDFDAVFEACDDFTPSTVHEVLKRAQLRSMRRNDGKVGDINTHDLVGAARSLYPQLKLMEDARELQKRNELADAMNGVVQEAARKAVVGMNIVRESNGDTWATLQD